MLTRQSGYPYMLIEAVLGLATLAAPGDTVAAARWVAAVGALELEDGTDVETPADELLAGTMTMGPRGEE